MKTINHQTIFLAALAWVMLAVSPSNAHAYVDPGFFSSIYQFVYVVLFGVVAGAIFKPWAYLKDKFFSKNKETKPAQEDKE